MQTISANPPNLRLFAVQPHPLHLSLQVFAQQLRTSRVIVTRTIQARRLQVVRIVLLQLSLQMGSTTSTDPSPFTTALPTPTDEHQKTAMELVAETGSLVLGVKDISEVIDIGHPGSKRRSSDYE